MKISGIAATINDSIISFYDDNNNYVPHVNGQHFFQGESREKITSFGEGDKKVFQSYINKIPNNGIIIIGENTFKDSFKLFNKILNSKNIKFIISNKNEVKILETNKEDKNWLNTIENKIIKLEDAEGYDSKNKLFNIAINESTLNADNIYVMGGKTVYETFKGYYNEFIFNNINIDQNELDKIKKRHNIDFKSVRF